LFFYKLLICTVEIFLLISAAFFRKLPKFTSKLYLFYVLYILNKIIYKLMNKLRLLHNSRPHSSTFRY
jgi:hypothetical protein